MEVVEKDFAYLKGWYDDDWFWLTVGVAPIDEDGEIMEDYRSIAVGTKHDTQRHRGQPCI